MNKWSNWWDSLDANTKTYLENQAIWRDRDLYKFCTITFILGLAIGALLTWH